MKEFAIKLNAILLLVVLDLLLLWKFNITSVILWMISSALLLYAWESGLILRGLREIWQKALRKIWQEVLRKKSQTALLVVILILLSIWKFNITSVILWMISSALLLYAWESGLIFKVLMEAWKDILLRKKLQTVLLSIILSLLLLWQLSDEIVIFTTIFFIFLLYKWDIRIMVGATLVFLASCPILVIYKRENIAEIMAVYAYYFLVIVIILQVKEYLEESRINLALRSNETRIARR